MRELPNGYGERHIRVFRRSLTNPQTLGITQTIKFDGRTSATYLIVCFEGFRMADEEIVKAAGSAPTAEVDRKPATRRPRKPKEPASEAQVAAEAKRTRTQRPFPASSFEEALTFARDLYRVGSGQPVRRLTLFNDLGKAPDSGPSRMLITNSNRYGLTKGSYASDYLELTDDGRKAVDEQVAKREQRRAWATLA